MKTAMNPSNRFFAVFKPLFVSFLKTLLKVTGFKAWLVGVLAEEFFDEVAVPLIKAGMVEVGYQYDRIDGKGMLKKLKDADNDQEYDDAVDDILGGN